MQGSGTTSLLSGATMSINSVGDMDIDDSRTLATQPGSTSTWSSGRIRSFSGSTAPTIANGGAFFISPTELDQCLLRQLRR